MLLYPVLFSPLENFVNRLPFVNAPGDFDVVRRFVLDKGQESERGCEAERLIQRLDTADSEFCIVHLTHQFTVPRRPGGTLAYAPAIRRRW